MDSQQMRLVIDSREPLTPDDNPTQFSAISNHVPEFSREFRALDVGDYLIEKDGHPALCIERKTVADLVASIADGRHREQKARLITAFGQSVLFVIEGNPFQQVFKSRINPYTVWSSIVNSMYRDGFRVVMTRSYSETLELIQHLVVKIHKTGLVATATDGGGGEALSSQIRTRKRDNITPEFLLKNFLASITGISWKMAEDIVGALEITDMRGLIRLADQSRDDFITAVNEKYRQLMETCGESKRSIGAIAGRIYDQLGTSN
jgi:ERCC4-type nuclease